MFGKTARTGIGYKVARRQEVAETTSPLSLCGTEGDAGEDKTATSKYPDNVEFPQAIFIFFNKFARVSAKKR